MPTGNNSYFITREKKKKSVCSIRDDGNRSQQWWLICDLSDGLDKQRDPGSLLSLIYVWKQTEMRGRERERKKRAGEWEAVLIGLSQASVRLGPRGRGAPALHVEKLCLHGELMTLIYEESMKSGPLWRGCHSEPNFPCITFAALR